jgi:hypothetical protein
VRIGISVLLVANALTCIYTIGRERRPITPVDAIAVTVVDAVIVWWLWQ